MKTYTLLFFFLISLNFIFAQTEDTTEVVKKHHKKEKFGPKNKHFVHAYFNLMFATPPKEGTDADIIYGKSHSVSYGLRYRFKIANFFAVGTGINYTYRVWHFKQTETKQIPTSVIYDKEKLKINTFEGDVFIRFNICKNKRSPVGNYIDIGSYANWDFYDKRKFTNFVDLTTPEGYATSTGINSSLNYLNKINYGTELRIGYGRIVLVGKYRLSDIFTSEYKTSVSSTELPRLMVGFEIGFHK